MIMEEEINPRLKNQFTLFSKYFLRLCDFDHFLKNASLKVFLEKKSDLQHAMTFILKQYNGLYKGEEPIRIFEYCDRLKEVFGLRDVDLANQDKKMIRLRLKLEKHMEG